MIRRIWLRYKDLHESRVSINVNKQLSKGSLEYMTCIVVDNYIWYNLYMDLLYYARLIKIETYDIW